MAEQLALLEFIVVKVHGLPLKLPAPEVEKLTLPVGVLLVPDAVSVTVAVQVVETPARTLVGLQLTVVLVFRLLTVTVAVPLLVLCTALPP